MNDLKEPLLPKPDPQELPPNRPCLGYLFQLLFMLQLCFQQFLSKYLFTRHPSLDPTQLLFLRSAISSLVFLGLMNKDFAQYMWKSIPREQYPNLAFRVAQSSLFLICLFTCVKYLPLVYISLSNQLGPLFTAVLSYYILHVGLSRLDTLVLLVSFCGVLLLITGYVNTTPAQEEQENTFWPFVLMMCLPVLTSCNAIVLRKMRDMSEYTVGAHSTFSICLLYTPIVLFTQGFSVFTAFSSTDWLLALVLGIVSSCQQLCRIKAVQYEEPARLAVVNYFQTIIQLGFDVLFYGTVFTAQQAWGIAVVFGANSVKWGVTVKRMVEGAQAGKKMYGERR